MTTGVNNSLYKIPANVDEAALDAQLESMSAAESKIADFRTSFALDVDLFDQNALNEVEKTLCSMDANDVENLDHNTVLEMYEMAFRKFYQAPDHFRALADRAVADLTQQ